MLAQMRIEFPPNVFTDIADDQVVPVNHEAERKTQQWYQPDQLWIERTWIGFARGKANYHSHRGNPCEQSLLSKCQPLNDFGARGVVERQRELAVVERHGLFERLLFPAQRAERIFQVLQAFFERFPVPRIA